MKDLLYIVLGTIIACVLAVATFVINLAFAIVYYAIIGLGVILLIKYVLIGWLI